MLGLKPIHGRQRNFPETKVSDLSPTWTCLREVWRPNEVDMFLAERNYVMFG